MLNDMDFIKTCDVPGPTKEAIRAIILYKSAVTPNDEVVDVGCGTGGITCEFAQRAKKVTSIDTNPDAISVTKQNLEKFNLGDNVELINDSGSNALKNIDNMDIAVVGGTGGTRGLILQDDTNTYWRLTILSDGSLFTTTI